MDMKQLLVDGICSGGTPEECADVIIQDLTDLGNRRQFEVWLEDRKIIKKVDNVVYRNDQALYYFD